MKYLNKKRLIVALLMLAAVVAAVASNVSIGEFFGSEQSVSLKFQTGIEYKTAQYGKNILLVNNEGIKCMNKNGREVFEIANASTMPKVQAIGTYIMLADINGKAVSLYRNEKLIGKIKTESEIISAKMNKNGYIVIASDELGYKGMITLYNKEGKELFKWHSGSGYISDMDLSADNTIFVSQVMTDKESVYSRLLKIDTKSEKEAECVAELGGVGLKVICRSGGTVSVLTDGGIYGFRKRGGEKFKAEFKGRTPIAYNIENEHNMVIAFLDNINNTVLESYSSNGELRGTYAAKEEVKSFNVSGECIVAGKSREIVRVAPNGTVKTSAAISHDISCIEIFPSRDRAIIIGGNSADIIKIR